MANQIINYGKALYYPHINLSDMNWLKTASLFYDGLYRIVPFDFEPNDNDLIKRLNENERFISNINPRRYAQEVGREFLDFAINELRDGALRENLTKKLNIIIPNETHFDIHNDKLSYMLQSELSELGLAKKDEKNPFWFRFEPVTGAIYMTFLANKLAEKKRIPIVTDNPIFQPLIRYSQNDIFNFDFADDVGETLASVVINSAIPENIEDIPIHKIVKFRKTYKDERRLFYKEINNLVAELRNVEDSEVLRDCIEYKRKDIEGAVSNLKRAYHGIGISTTTALLGLSVPAFASGLGAAIATGGIITVATGKLIEQGIKCYKSRKESPYSYVLLLNKNLNSESLAKQLISGKLLI